MSRGWGWGFSRSSSVTSETWNKQWTWDSLSEKAGPLVLGNSSLADRTSFYVFKLWARWVRGRGRGGTWAHGRRLALRTAKSVCWTQTRSKEWLLLQQENMSAVGSGGAVCGETSRASRRIFQRSNTRLSALCSELALKSAPPLQHTLSLFFAWKPNFRGGRLTSAVDCFMPYFLSSECPWSHHHDLIWSQELEKQIVLPYGGWPAGP